MQIPPKGSCAWFGRAPAYNFGSRVRPVANPFALRTNCSSAPTSLWRLPQQSSQLFWSPQLGLPPKAKCESDSLFRPSVLGPLTTGLRRDRPSSSGGGGNGCGCVDAVSSRVDAIVVPPPPRLQAAPVSATATASASAVKFGRVFGSRSKVAMGCHGVAADFRELARRGRERERRLRLDARAADTKCVCCKRSASTDAAACHPAKLVKMEPLPPDAIGVVQVVDPPRC